MKTASFFTYAGPGRISVARYAPRHTPAGFRVYSALAPARAWHNLPKPQFCRVYFGALLSKLEARQVWDELHTLAGDAEPVLCCWERLQREGEWCHRSLIAAWFKRELGELVDEMPVPGAG